MESWTAGELWMRSGGLKGRVVKAPRICRHPVGSRDARCVAGEVQTRDSRTALGFYYSPLVQSASNPAMPGLESRSPRIHCDGHACSRLLAPTRTRWLCRALPGDPGARRLDNCGHGHLGIKAQGIGDKFGCPLAHMTIQTYREASGLNGIASPVLPSSGLLPSRMISQGLLAGGQGKGSQHLRSTCYRRAQSDT